jgi:hypothetical protein
MHYKQVQVKRINTKAKTHCKQKKTGYDHFKAFFCIMISNALYDYFCFMVIIVIMIFMINMVIIFNQAILANIKTMVKVNYTLCFFVLVA